MRRRFQRLMTGLSPKLGQPQSGLIDAASIKGWIIALTFCMPWHSPVAIGSEDGVEHFNPWRQCTDLGLVNGAMIVKGLFEDCSEGQVSQVNGPSRENSSDVACYRFNVSNESTIVIGSEAMSNVWLSANLGGSWLLVSSSANDGLVVPAADGTYVLAVLAPACKKESGFQWHHRFRISLESTQEREPEAADIGTKTEGFEVLELSVPEKSLAFGIGMWFVAPILAGLAVLIFGSAF